MLSTGSSFGQCPPWWVTCRWLDWDCGNPPQKLWNLNARHGGFKRQTWVKPMPFAWFWMFMRSSHCVNVGSVKDTVTHLFREGLQWHVMTLVWSCMQLLSKGISSHPACAWGKRSMKNRGKVIWLACPRWLEHPWRKLKPATKTVEIKPHTIWRAIHSIFRGRTLTWHSWSSIYINPY